MLIIGVGNKARNGKDSFVSAITEYYEALRARQIKHGLKPTAPITQRIGFADELYRVCEAEYGMTTKDAALLQRVGAERRETDPLYWVKKAFGKINKASDIILFSDARYKNEATFIKEQGGYVLNVTRMKDGKPYIATDRPADHPSEIDLDGYPFDFYLTNSDGHQALLKEQAITLVTYLRGLHV